MYINGRSFTRDMVINCWTCVYTYVYIYAYTYVRIFLAVGVDHARTIETHYQARFCLKSWLAGLLNFPRFLLIQF